MLCEEAVCVCVFFFFEVHSFCCWGENTHICIQLHSWWEARHMVGTRTTRQRKRAAHVAEARERFFQQFIKANKWNETMRKTKRLDRPPAGTVKCCFFLFSIPSSRNKLANYVQGALPQNLCYTNRVVAGPWKSCATEINYGNRFIRSLSTIKPWQY